VWLAGRRCFRGGRVTDYRSLFAFCTVAFLLLAGASYVVDNEHNRINRYLLDVRWPEAYRAANPGGLDAFRRQNAMSRKIGADLAARLGDPDFIEALHGGRFYKQHFDEPFQLRNRAVIFGYRPKSAPGAGLVAIRFPKELADALQFELVGEVKP
jgi:hypothetical protein